MSASFIRTGSIKSRLVKEDPDTFCYLDSFRENSKMYVSCFVTTPTSPGLTYFKQSENQDLALLPSWAPYWRLEVLNQEKKNSLVNVWKTFFTRKFEGKLKTGSLKEFSILKEERKLTMPRLLSSILLFPFPHTYTKRKS